MATTKGIGVVYGTSVTGLTFTGSADITSTSESYERSAEKEELPDNTGSIQTLVIKKNSETLKLKVYPSGPTADANALPELYSQVTIVGGDTQVTGTWLAEKVSRERKIDGIVEFDLGLIRYLDDAGVATGVMA